MKPSSPDPGTPKTVVMLFFLQAMAGGGIFVRIPDIQANLELSEAQLGLLLMTQAMGGFLSYILASFLVERAGTRVVCAVTVPLLAIAAAAVAFAPTAVLAGGAFVLYGVSFSLSNVAMNVEADRVEAACGRRIMNRCHGVWSIGILTASLIGVLARGWSVPPTVHLGLVVPVLIGACLVLILGWVPARPREANRAGRGRIRIPLPSPMTLRIVGFGVVGGLSQGATNNWSVIYMRDSFAAPDWVDALTIPGFLIALSLGRLLGDGWVARFGTRRVARTLYAVAGLGMVLVSVAPVLWVALLGFALLGLGICVSFPMMVTAAAALTDRPASENVSAVTMTMGLAMLVTPSLMGAIAEFAGIRMAFVATLPVFVFGYVLAGRVFEKASD